VTSAPSAPAPPAAAASLEALLAALETLPVQRSTALQVVRLCAKRGVPAAEVAQALASDPSLSARLLRLANSAAYGLPNQVTSLRLAVMTAGFTTVRAVCATAVARTVSGRPLPAAFWPTAAATAAGAALDAGNAGVAREDAFSVGVLHELGSALLLQVDPAGWPPLVEAEVAAGRCTDTAERERYGTDHAWAAARVMQAWGFPEPLVMAVADQHLPGAATSPLCLALRGGRALAALVPGTSCHDPADARGDALRALRITPGDVPALAAAVTTQTAEFTAALAG